MNSNFIVYNSLKLEPKLKPHSKIIRCIITPRGCDEVRQNKPLQPQVTFSKFPLPHTWLPWKWNIKIIKWLFSLQHFEENIHVAQEINKQTKIKAIKK